MRCLMVLWVTLTCTTPAWADSRALFSSPENVDLYLRTVDVGNLVFSNFGHTMIRVVDHEAGIDVLFNWGIFSFRNPISFSYRYFLRPQEYRLAAYSTPQGDLMQRDDQRTVWEDKFNLTSEQKRILLQRMEENLRPENRGYIYHYFYDNCATRPRDFINEALGGALQENAARTTGEPYRAMVRQYFATTPGIDLSLDLLMNSNIDHVMSVWEKMFIPHILQEELKNLSGSVAGPDGKPLPVLTPVRTTQEFLPPSAPFITPWWFVLIVSALACAAALSAHSLGWRFFGGWCFVFGFYSGLCGVLMPICWLFSAHPDVHHNVNMLAFFPFDMVLAWGGILWLVRGKPLQVSPRAWRWINPYISIHLVGWGAFSIMGAWNVWDQGTDRIAGYLIPALAMIALIIARRGLIRPEAAKLDA